MKETENQTTFVSLKLFHCRMFILTDLVRLKFYPRCPLFPKPFHFIPKITIVSTKISLSYYVPSTAK